MMLYIYAACFSFSYINLSFATGALLLFRQGSKQPLVATGWNFIGTVPLTLLTMLLFHDDIRLTSDGMIIATVSGALASSLAY